MVQIVIENGNSFYGVSMKGWKIVKPSTLEEVEITEIATGNSVAKVKITKALITLPDVMRYSAETDSGEFTPGSYGIGVVSEADANLFGLEKGSHVYIEPTRACGECYNCKREEEDKCACLLTAGEDFDGFLRDFTAVDSAKLYPLPESVSDFQALFIGHISLAVAVIDKLEIQKGDYVAIIGANNFANILAQLLIYYQAVPIVVTQNKENYEIAKKSGIYYILGPDDNWQKEVASITGGRMTKSAVYVSDCSIPANKAFSLASFSADVAFTGFSYKNSAISLGQAMKKQIDIHCINTGSGNVSTSINLLANKAIDLSHLPIKTAKYADVPAVFEESAKMLENDGTVYETVIELL